MKDPDACSRANRDVSEFEGYVSPADEQDRLRQVLERQKRVATREELFSRKAELGGLRAGCNVDVPRIERHVGDAKRWRAGGSSVPVEGPDPERRKPFLRPSR